MVLIEGKYNTAVCYTPEMEPVSAGQVKAVCDQEVFAASKIRIMPDVHAGMGCTIGTTMTIVDKVVPGMVGVDIGCGMETVKLAEREIDFEALDELIRREIPCGREVRDSLHPLNEEIDLNELCCSPYVGLPRARRSIGTLGGGNHFIEVDRGEDGALWLVVHSGSRHLGKEVCEYAVFFAVALTFLFGGWLSNTRFGNLTESADTMSRMPMLLTALNTMIHHLFGVGSYVVNPELIVGASTSTYSFVLNNTAHNLIGNCAASYGLIGLVLMLLIYVNCFRVFRSIKSTSSYYNYSFCSFSCLLVLATNAFFHNLYILNGEIGSFMFIGLLLAVYRNVCKENGDAIFIRGSTLPSKSISNYRRFN